MDVSSEFNTCALARIPTVLCPRSTGCHSSIHRNGFHTHNPDPSPDNGCSLNQSSFSLRVHATRLFLRALVTLHARYAPFSELPFCQLYSCSPNSRRKRVTH